ncbi:MAG: hypothetical protein Q8L13_11915 [Bradyrhizobium sp.]|uniref:hypothetical protein n=1 Tax=Bradyrhizobium sp. TaxID=376 RepID=UPI00272FB890|nr:hypothetical protein [Bradyrhizobium sp.]MDP1867032.1 hypothetical protein [Bradyrhizobium sp.]
MTSLPINGSDLPYGVDLLNLLDDYVVSRGMNQQKNPSGMLMVTPGGRPMCKSAGRPSLCETHLAAGAFVVMGWIASKVSGK